MKRLVLLASAFLLAACAGQPTRTPPSTSLPQSQVGDAQQRLNSLGFYRGPADGILGPESQTAIEGFQRNRGLVATARLDNPTIVALHGESQVTVRMPSLAEISEAQQRLRAMGLYQGPVSGQWSPDTQLAVENFQRKRGIAATAWLDSATLSALGADEPARRAAATQPIELTEAVVRAIQNRLGQLNFYDGRADGVWGERTQQALESFRHASGLPVGQQVTAQTLSAMGL